MLQFANMTQPDCVTTFPRKPTIVNKFCAWTGNAFNALWAVS